MQPLFILITNIRGLKPYGSESKWRVVKTTALELFTYRNVKLSNGQSEQNKLEHLGRATFHGLTGLRDGKAMKAQLIANTELFSTVYCNTSTAV